MNWVCAICKKEFSEEIMQVSHDIPRYMGGTDKDGRHTLCFSCHIIYEDLILKECCSLLGIDFIQEERIKLMISLKKLSEKHKEKFREIAFKIKGDFYGKNKYKNIA